MPTLRLFVAIEIPDEVKAQLAGLKTDLPGAVWVKPAALHVTLKFLGDGISAGRVPELTDSLNTVRGEPFMLALEGVGRFPPGERAPARVLWAGLAAPRELARLAAAVDVAMAALGFAPETRPFAPHLTLARLKDAHARAEVAAFLSRHAGLRSAPFPVQACALFSSQLTSQGAVYTRLAEFPLYR
jgi:2'-5' RNA ligase